MTTTTTPDTLGNILLVEVKSGWTKQRVMFAQSQCIFAGMVLACVAGKYLPLDLNAKDGAEIAVGIAADMVDAVNADACGVVIVRGAVVDVASLLWPAGISDLQKTDALARLEARGIVAVIPLAI